MGCFRRSVFHQRPTVFDGLRANISMMEKLGAQFNLDDPKPYFIQSCKKKVYIIPDVPHLIKLARNCLVEYGEIVVPGFATPAKWSYIASLYEFQKDAGTRLMGNKLTKKHIEYVRYKMRVPFATQVLSSSVADALDFLRERGVSEFQGSEATADFCRRLTTDLMFWTPVATKQTETECQLLLELRTFFVVFELGRSREKASRLWRKIGYVL